MWPLDSSYPISYSCHIVTKPLSPALFEILGPKFPCTHTHTRTRPHSLTDTRRKVILYSVPCKVLCKVLHWTDKYTWKLVVVWFICLCTWKNRVIYLNMCYFGRTKVEMKKFATVMANCVQNNLWKFLKEYWNVPSAAILHLIELQIAPFDPATPKTIAQNQTWSRSDAPFARYSPINYTVTLKLGFGVT